MLSVRVASLYVPLVTPSVMFVAPPTGHSVIVSPFSVKACAVTFEPYSGGRTTGAPFHVSPQPVACGFVT
jgi:hypothetical protein